MLAFAIFLISTSCAGTDKNLSLKLVNTIALKGPSGRLDHLALDTKHQRLFVANMANASLDVVDLKEGKLVKQIPDQKGIQGIAYAPDLNRIFVGNGEGGACNVFDGDDYKLLKSLPLDDADNVRYDAKTMLVYVAHAEKSLAVIDPKEMKVLKEIKLSAAPESFQLAVDSPRLYLNAPKPPQVIVIDTKKREEIHCQQLSMAKANYPMAFDEDRNRLYIGCRDKPMLVVFDTESNKEVASVPIPGDVDDVFYDAKGKRVYASCGEGFLAVVEIAEKDRPEMNEKIATVKGARTCLFDAESGRLYLVVPRQEGKDGPEIRVYQAP
jgi:DNA-binding beta-propeller fold protein YncE